MMKLTLTAAVSLALQTLGDDDRRRIFAWFDSLANWETDPHVRQISKALPGDENIFVLRTSSDLRIFFTVRDKEILILDVARKDSIERLSASPAQKGA